jgi:hypothetical protein
MDSLVAVNMIITRKSDNLHILPLLQEALPLMDRSYWNCEIKHTIYQEVDCYDVSLANLGHDDQLDLIKFPSLHSSLLLLLFLFFIKKWKHDEE